MVYECDICEAALGPGWTACPRCGQVFDEPVPADALLDEPVPAADASPADASPADASPADASPAEVVLDVVAPPRRQASRKPNRWPEAVTFLLLGLGWLGYRHWNAPAVPKPVSAPVLPTDLAAHPQYATHMSALVQQLRGMGVGAEWPAFGGSDVLLVTPQAHAAEPPVAWDADMNRRLAQGLYGDFVLTRHEAGFPDADAMACFVIVTGASGQVVAVDFMGDLR